MLVLDKYSPNELNELEIQIQARRLQIQQEEDSKLYEEFKLLYTHSNKLGRKVYNIYEMVTLLGVSRGKVNKLITKFKKDYDDNANKN